MHCRAPALVSALACAVLLLLVSWRLLALHADAVAGAKSMVQAAQLSQLRGAKEALLGRLAWPLRDTQYLATHQTLQRYVSQPSTSGLWDLSENMFDWMASRQDIYAQARYLNDRGWEAVRVGSRGGETFIVGEADLQNKAERYYFQAAHALPAGAVYISPFDLNVENGQVQMPLTPTLRFAAKVFDESQRAKGVVVINFLGQSLIDRLRAVGRQSGQPLWLLNGNGHWLMSDQPAQEWGFMFPDKKQPAAAQAHPAVWAQLQAHAAGELHQVELEGGLLAFISLNLADELARESRTRILSDTGHWHLVSWVSSDDLAAQLAPIAAQHQRYAVFWVLLILSLSVAGGYVLHRRALADEALRHANAQLLTSNKELETFSYTVSHDLRSPLRAIDGYSRILLQSSASQLDDTGKDYLQRMRAASQRMGSMIDDILMLSRISRQEVERRSVDLSAIGREIVEQIRAGEPDRSVEVRIDPSLQVLADERLVRIALENLLRNAWKFTSKCDAARIEVGCEGVGPAAVFHVRDNGAGFDMAYADKLFGAFQRLHQASEFPGSGIGLATVQRVIHKHGGRIWATGVVGAGATFHFTFNPSL